MLVKRALYLLNARFAITILDLISQVHLVKLNQNIYIYIYIYIYIALQNIESLTLRHIQTVREYSREYS